MTMISTASPVHEIHHPLFEQHGVQVYVKRDDLIHPIISGNKWRKLKYQLADAKAKQKNHIISFGGAFSNHIHALAFACYQQGLKCTGIIRGEQENSQNFTLSCAQQWGMDLNFVPRQTYRQRNDPDFIAALSAQYPQALIVPEGGSAELAIPGVAELCLELNQQVDVDFIITPVGSGGTLAGIIAGAKDKQQVLGIAVLKNADYLREQVVNLLPSEFKSRQNWQLLTQYHCGGYARFTGQNLEQMQVFMQHCQLPLEPIYSGKMALAVMSLIAKKQIKRGQKVALIHTGGLQGLHGLAERQLINSDHWPVPALPVQQRSDPDHHQCQV